MEKDVMLPRSNCGFHTISAIFCCKIRQKNTHFTHYCTFLGFSTLYLLARSFVCFFMLFCNNIWCSYSNLLQSATFSTILDCQDRPFFHFCIMSIFAIKILFCGGNIPKKQFPGLLDTFYTWNVLDSPIFIHISKKKWQCLRKVCKFEVHDVWSTFLS